MAFNFEDYFSPQTVGAYWEESPSSKIPYLGSAFFSYDKKMGLDLSWFKGAGGVSVSLMPSAFDSRAKFRDHVSFSKEQTEMPFFREGYLIKEKDRQELLRAQEANDPYARAILSRILNETADLIEGARVVPERMIWSLLAPENGNSGISIVANGCDYTYNYDPNGKWKASNYSEITTEADKWSASETADPIGDLQELQTTAENRNGVALDTLVMSPKTLKYLLKSSAIKSAVLSQNVTANVFVTRQTVENVLQNLLGIRAIVYRKQYRESISAEPKPFYPDNYITLVPSGRLGTVWRGTTPEEADLMSKRDADVYIVDNGIAINRVITAHPVNTEIYASEIVLPSFERMNDVYVMKVA